VQQFIYSFEYASTRHHGRRRRNRSATDAQLFGVVVFMTKPIGSDNAGEHVVGIFPAAAA
jgi:hypothetical protein